jgi:hypothetical protein
MQNNHLILSLPEKRRVFVTGPRLTVVCLWSFSTITAAGICMEKKKWGKWKYLFSKRQGRLPA